MLSQTKVVALEVLAEKCHLITGNSLTTPLKHFCWFCILLHNLQVFRHNVLKLVTKWTLGFFPLSKSFNKMAVPRQRWFNNRREKFCHILLLHSHTQTCTWRLTVPVTHWTTGWEPNTARPVTVTHTQLQSARQSHADNGPNRPTLTLRLREPNTLCRNPDSLPRTQAPRPPEASRDAALRFGSSL